MPEKIPTPLELTESLRSAGVLLSGAVEDAVALKSGGRNSQVHHLSVRYTDDASGSCPQRLLLKLDSDHSGAGEVGLYQWMARLSDPVPWLPRCFAASYDPVSGRSACLLEDLSASHEPPLTREGVLSGRGVPPDRRMHLIVTALACLHAYWWQHEALGEDFAEVRGWYADASHFKMHVARRESEYASFMASVGTTVSDEVKRTCEFVLGRLPSLWSRHLERRILGRAAITLTHGDCYLEQFLVPRKESGNHAVIVDFQDVSANLGAFDLVFLMPTFWTPDQRAEQKREFRLLRHYHNTLLARGIQDFSLEQLLDDYRLMIAIMVFDPIWNQTSDSSERYWRSKLDCLVGAFQDLDCRRLLV